MPGVMSAVLPEPPRPTIPIMSDWLRSTQVAKASDMAATASPRSLVPVTDLAPFA